MSASPPPKSPSHSQSPPAEEESAQPDQSYSPRPYTPYTYIVFLTRDADVSKEEIREAFSKVGEVQDIGFYSFFLYSCSLYFSYCAHLIVEKKKGKKYFFVSVIGDRAKILREMDKSTIGSQRVPITVQKAKKSLAVMRFFLFLYNSFLGLFLQTQMGG